MKRIVFLSLTTIILFVIGLFACKSSKISEAEVVQSITVNMKGAGPELLIEFSRGPAHNHPSFVFWAEDMDGNFIQTLFISKAVGTSVYEHGDPSSGKWEPGSIRRPASLPYWAHKRGVREKDGLFIPSLENPVADAYTGATPAGDFALQTRFDNNAPAKFKLLMEINQPWDWNEYWTNDKYPDDMDYKTSCQPALVYELVIDQTKSGNGDEPAEMQVIGHSHCSGRTGELFPDLETITTALDITEKVSVRLK